VEVGRELSARPPERANVGSNFHTLRAGSSPRRAGVYIVAIMRIIFINLRRELAFTRVSHTNYNCSPFFCLFVSRKSSLSAKCVNADEDKLVLEKRELT